MGKSFQTYAPTKGDTFDVNGEVFQLKPSIPGDLLLDFMGGLDDEKPSAVAATIRSLMQAAIVEEDYVRWTQFIRDPRNNVDLDILGQIAGHVAEKLSGKDQQPVPTPYGAG